jgi:uncharacterized protein (TIGR02996 family)
MNEEDAFLRGIADDPCDDLLRSVYADWLDDRGDPRGAYLRAARAALASGDVEDLLAMAARLDPVWVARVSLPPVGVCCAHLIFVEFGPRLDAADVAATERRLGVTLPADYKAFLLNYNGGRIDVPLQTPTGEPLPDEETDWTFYPAAALRRFGTSPEEKDDPPDVALTAWLSRFVCVGHQYGDAVLLGVSGPDFGQVRLVDAVSGYDYGFERYRRGRSANAATFAALLAHLPSYPRPLNEGDVVE